MREGSRDPGAERSGRRRGPRVRAAHVAIQRSGLKEGAQCFASGAIQLSYATEDDLDCINSGVFHPDYFNSRNGA